MVSPSDRQQAAKAVIATTVALSFISFWRTTAIVLSDLASSAFYAGGIAEKAIGPSAPWFILGVMFFSFAARSVYIESGSMFVRGGVYAVVRDAMGSFVARFSVCIGLAWEVFVNLGPHPPRLWPEDLARLHDLWLWLTGEGFGSKLHHRDVVGVALGRLEMELDGPARAQVLEDLKKEIHKS